MVRCDERCDELRAQITRCEEFLREHSCELRYYRGLVEHDTARLAKLRQELNDLTRIRCPDCNSLNFNTFSADPLLCLVESAPDRKLLITDSYHDGDFSNWKLVMPDGTEADGNDVFGHCNDCKCEWVIGNPDMEWA